MESPPQTINVRRRVRAARLTPLCLMLTNMDVAGALVGALFESLTVAFTWRRGIATRTVRSSNCTLQGGELGTRG
jgi:hypothetical protein